MRTITRQRAAEQIAASERNRREANLRASMEEAARQVLTANKRADRKRLLDFARRRNG